MSLDGEIVTDETINLPVPVDETRGPLGSQPLTDPRRERYAQARALLQPRAQAYRDAGFSAEQNKIAQGNAGRVENYPDVAARIAWLSRQTEEVFRKKRQAIEEFLWKAHNFDQTVAWETIEVDQKNRKGEIVRDAYGEPVKRRIARPKMIDELPEEAKAVIENITLNDQGIAVPKFYSAMAANQELRKFLNMGYIERSDGDIGRISDAELIAQLATQARELGIQIDLSYRLGKPPEET